MTKKSINRILIVIVTLIWGILLYQILGKRHFDVQQFTPHIESQDSQEFLIIKDTFELVKLSRDPFLGLVYERKKNKQSNTVVKKKKVNTNTVTIKIPRLQYLGYVKGEKYSNPLILIRIDNKLYKKRLNSKVKDVYLKEASKDSLVIIFNGTLIKLPKI